MGEDGCVGLSSRGFNAVAEADVLVGALRFLDFFGDFPGPKIQMGEGGAKLSDVVARVVELVAQKKRVAVLASGDPMFFGIGALLGRQIAPFPFEVIPHPSSVQWAFARLGWKWDDADVVSFHGRPLRDWILTLRTTEKIAVLTDGESSPPRLAALMEAAGEIHWECWVGESLGGSGERLRSFTVAELAQEIDIGPLNLLVMRRKPSEDPWQPPAVIPFLGESLFSKKVPKLGLITKREVRILSLAALGLRPGGTLWDVGAGSGSLSIEAVLMTPRLKAYAIETDPECVRMCELNAGQFGLDLQGAYRVIHGLAPDCLAGLPRPDGVFIGGSKGQLGAIMKIALQELKPGGRLVVNAITLENVNEAYQGFLDLGLMPELSLVQVSRGAPLAGKYLRYEALNPVHIFWAEKPQNTLHPKEPPVI